MLSFSKMPSKKLALIALVAGSIFGSGTVPPASAAEVVAIGASQTFGKGVSRSSAYPAQLEKLLRASGLQVRVKNAGINGATTGKILRNLGQAIGKDTKVVLFQPGTNDARKGKQEKTEPHIQKIKAKLAARNIRVVMVTQGDYAEYPRGADGLHLTEEGYAKLAKKLLPRVISALN